MKRSLFGSSRVSLRQERIKNQQQQQQQHNHIFDPTNHEHSELQPFYDDYEYEPPLFQPQEERPHDEEGRKKQFHPRATATSCNSTSHQNINMCYDRPLGAIVDAPSFVGAVECSPRFTFSKLFVLVHILAVLVTSLLAARIGGGVGDFAAT